MKLIGSKRQVMNGTASHTSGGLTSSDIKIIKKNGLKRYISKSKSIKGKQNKWIKASVKARKNLGLEHTFVLMKKSSPLYKETARIYYGTLGVKTPRRKSRKSSKKRRSN